VDDDRWDEQLGSVAEEAQRLLESLRRAGGGPGPEDDEGAPSAPRAAEDRSAEEAWVCTDPFCRSCPLCRTVAVVRGLSPETLRRLADLATVAAGVLVDLAGDRAGRPPDPPDGGAAQPAPERPAERGPGSSAAAAQPITVRPAEEGTDD
jgi:hypothetical protein